MKATTLRYRILSGFAAARSFFYCCSDTVLGWIDGTKMSIEPLEAVRIMFWNGTSKLVAGEKFEVRLDSDDRSLRLRVSEEYQAAGFSVIGCLALLVGADGKHYALQWLEVRNPRRREDIYSAREDVKAKLPEHVRYPKTSLLSRLKKAG